MNAISLLIGAGAGFLFAAAIFAAMLNVVWRQHKAETAVLEDELEKLRAERSRHNRPHSHFDQRRLAP